MTDRTPIWKPGERVWFRDFHRRWCRATVTSTSWDHCGREWVKVEYPDGENTETYALSARTEKPRYARETT